MPNNIQIIHVQECGSVAGVAQTESGYGCNFTGKTPFVSKSCTCFYLIYIRIINFIALTIADFPYFSPNVDMIIIKVNLAIRV